MLKLQTQALIQDETNQPSDLKKDSMQLQKILVRHEGIMKSPVRRRVYYWFLENIAATGSLIVAETDIPEASVYNQLKWLKRHGFIEPQGKIKSVKKGGPKPVLYSLPGASKEDLARTILSVQKANQPTYRLVTELTQLCWEDVEDMEIQMSKIIGVCRMRSRGFHFLGIADMVAKELHEKEVKVWR